MATAMIRSLLLLLGILAMSGCDVASAGWWSAGDREPGSSALPSPGAEGLPATARDQPLLPLPPAPSVDPRRAALGARLFSDPMLSSDGTVSCATCHPLDRAGADGLSHSRGVGGVETALNTPTIYNATFNFRFNWSGAFATLEDEFDAPVTKTMKTTWDEIDEKLRRDGAFAKAFAAAYPGGVSTENVKDALARYIDTLVTPNSRFDQYLRGDPDALTTE
jgi:cytochrome c peroxidase